MKFFMKSAFVLLSTPVVSLTFTAEYASALKFVHSYKIEIEHPLLTLLL